MSKILLFGNLSWSATSVCNENHIIAKTEYLKDLCSLVFVGFKVKYKDMIMEKIKHEESVDTYCDKIKEMFNKETAQILIDYNGDNHNVIFKCLEVSKFNLILKVEIFSLKESFVLKQGIMSYPHRFNEIERMNKTKEHTNNVNLIFSKSQRPKKITMFREKKDTLFRISWMFMEYLEFDFKKHLLKLDDKNATIDEDGLIKMLNDILNALNKCHDENIVHGDIKHENIMGRKEYSNLKNIDFVLIDFECSIQLNGGETETHGLEFKVGTEGFSAPEVMDQRQKLTTASDIWSFGIVIFELAFTDGVDKAHEIACDFFKLTEEDINLEIDKLKFSKKIKEFIKRCLRIKMEDRATVKQLLEDPLLTSDNNLFLNK